jgi:K+-transporting ATPase ATPase C chain
MKNQIRPLISVFALLTLIIGIFYPMLVTGLAQLFFPFQANGSLIKHNDKVLGSELIGQNFTGMQYFWSRPSATALNPYNAFDNASLTSSSGSNLGPLSLLLFNTVQTRTNDLKRTHPGNASKIPIDLITASGSGLDPHISLSAVYYQIPRVVKSRGLSELKVTQIVDKLIENRQFGFLGEPRVNVLLLNLALDGIQ